MPINLRIFTTPSDKNVILSKEKLARKGDIFMNLSIQDELQLFSEELYRHLTPSLLEELKRIRFCKKKTKVFGNELATICIWVSQRTASDSLVRLCSQLHATTGTLMSRGKDSINALIKSG
jgi:hypothetical protein